MISPLQATLRAAITDTVTRLYGLDAASLPAIAVEVPPRRALGDLAVPLAFELARRLRKAPRAIAQEIVAALGPLEGISTRGGGAERLHQRLPRSRRGSSRRATGRRGHRRGRISDGGSSAIRASIRSSSTRPSTRTRRPTSVTCAIRRSATRFVRLLRFSRRARSRCRTTSTTPACRSPTSWSDSASWRASRSTEIRAIADSTRRSGSTTTAGTSTRSVTEWYAGDKARLAVRSQALHDIEHGGNDPPTSPPSSPTASSTRT